MIAADDMRPELGCYGCAHMKTPHLDALAADSVVFDHAYVSVAWCSPSRTALLTSRRPDTTRTWSVLPVEYWRTRGGNFSTLPQVFKQHGFLTLGVGKIFHPGKASGNSDSMYSWSPESLPYDDIGKTCPTAPNGRNEILENTGSKTQAGGAMEPSETNPDTALADCANRTIYHLAQSRSEGSLERPFFFAVGFHKPHIPWNVPHYWYEMYPLNEVDLAVNPNPPVGVPPVAMNNILSGWVVHRHFCRIRSTLDSQTGVEQQHALLD